MANDRRLRSVCRALPVTGVLILLSLPAVAGAQAEFSGMPPPGAPTFDLDWAAFRIPGSDSARLDICYRITNPHLSYIRRTVRPSQPPMGTGTDSTTGTSESYAAAYELVAVLSSQEDRQVASVSTRENYTLATYAETRNPSGYLVNVLVATVPTADLDLATTLTDRISGSTHTIKRRVDLSQTSRSDWIIGGPEFFDPDASPPDRPQFRHGDTAFVPNVTRSFAGRQDRVAMYIEVYTETHPTARALLVQIDQRLGRRRRLDTIPLGLGRAYLPIIYRDPLTGFATGQVRLQLAVVDSLGRELGAPVESSFWIDWSLASVTSDNWDEAVDMLVHIAGTDELKKLRAVPPDEREAAFAAFWKSKDPSPETEENEWQEEYYRRIRFADLHFGTPFRRGWQTDFGTVYVKYGEPDEIERYPFERGSKPYQIWYYYGQRRRFVFVDTKGNGEYELQYPYDGLIR